MLKRCSKCRLPKSEDSYSKDRSRKFGLDLICKSCRAAYAAKRKAAKPRTHLCGTCCGTLEELGEQMVESFLQLPPERQEKLRKEIYESMTGKPYRPSTEVR
jgi:hypothetical protein